jgi:hypothetical protein
MAQAISGFSPSLQQYVSGRLLLFMSMWWDDVSELRPPTGLLFIPQLIYEYGEPRWNDTDRGNRRTRRKPVTVQLCPQHISHGPTMARTRSSAVRGRQLTSWAMAPPSGRLLPTNLRLCAPWFHPINIDVRGLFCYLLPIRSRVCSSCVVRW